MVEMALRNTHALRIGSIILHKDETNEKRTGMICDFNPAKTEALILWYKTHIPHWCCTRGLISREEWRERFNRKHNKGKP